SASAPGATIVVGDTTANQRGGVIGASTTRFYLSTNAVLDASDTLLGGRSVPDLAGNASNSGSTSVTLPTTITPGAYYVIGKADADNAVLETDESNNTTARSIQIGGDLLISALDVQVQGGGTSIIVSDTTTNAGGVTVGPSVTRFYLSRDTILDASDTVLGTRSVPTLDAGVG